MSCSDSLMYGWSVSGFRVLLSAWRRFCLKILYLPIIVPTIKATPLKSPTRLLRWRASSAIAPGPSSLSAPAEAADSSTPPPPPHPSSPPPPPPSHPAPVHTAAPFLPRNCKPSFGNALLFPETKERRYFLPTNHMSKGTAVPSAEAKRAIGMPY